MLSNGPRLGTQLARMPAMHLKSAIMPLLSLSATATLRRMGCTSGLLPSTVNTDVGAFQLRMIAGVLDVAVRQ